MLGKLRLRCLEVYLPWEEEENGLVGLGPVCLGRPRPFSWGTQINPILTHREHGAV